jgi:hypothetical protein
MNTEGGELPSSSFPTSTEFICMVAAVSCLRYEPLPIISWTKVSDAGIKGRSMRGESEQP